MPERIQRKRTKGWKMPPNTVSVCRPGPFGNPFKIGGYFMKGDFRGEYGAFRFIFTQCLEANADSRFTEIVDAKQAVEWYRWLLSVSPLTKVQVKELRGKNLACFCPLDQPCHADVLLEIANAALKGPQ